MSGSLAAALLIAERACVAAGVDLDTWCVLTNLAEALTMHRQASVTVGQLLDLAKACEDGGKE